MITLEILQNIWFWLFFILIIIYAILDGFDLGVGFWSLFERDPARKRHYMSVIAPVWDGNEVWLLTAGGALFAAFPPVYATVFSGMYIAVMFLIAALMLRAVSFEFAPRARSVFAQKTWGLIFGIASTLPAFLYGVAVGNIIRGLPVVFENESFIWKGSFLELINPFSILVGLMVTAMFATQGAFYLAYKTSGEIARLASRRAIYVLAGWLLLWLAALFFARTGATYIDSGRASFVLWLLLGLCLTVFVLAFLFSKAGHFLKAFYASSTTIALQTAFAAVALYPRLVPSSLDLQSGSLTIYNSSSSERTLFTMLVIAVIGVPIVLAYTVFVYRVFKGKIEPGEFYDHH